MSYNYTFEDPGVVPKNPFMTVDVVVEDSKQGFLMVRLSEDKDPFWIHTTGIRVEYRNDYRYATITLREKRAIDLNIA